jgi:polyisoprenoid-binding protein YceI
MFITPVMSFYKELNMIRQLMRYSLIAMALLTTSLPLHAAEKLTLDDKHTYVLWHIKHLGFSVQSGKWYASGFIILDKDHPQNSKVDATIDVTHFVTGIPELDKHLGGELFFDVKRFPKATFVSDKVDVTSKTTANVHGILTVHGISKPVTLKVTFNKAGKNPVNDQMTAGFSATTHIQRSDFGIKTLLPNLGDDVTLEINAEAYQPKP